MSIAIAIFGLAVLILIHEAGHFFAAKAVGMNPRKFYIGFPPALVKTNRGGVEYGIGAIPLGGYVKIPGMHRAAAGDLRGSLKEEDQEALAPELDRLDAALEVGDEETARSLLPALEARLGNNRMLQELDGSLADDAYWRQKSWKRIVVIGAGPFVNLVCALILFAAVFMTVSQLPSRTVALIEKGHPAATAGLKAGDKIVLIAGRPVKANTLPDQINATHGRPVLLTVVRKGKRLQLGPVRAKLDQGRYRIGIEIKGINGPGKSLPAASREAVHETWFIVDGEVKGIAQLFVGKGTKDVSSTVGIVRDTAQAYRVSLADYFYVLGFISLALAILNMLPILPLDGGHIVMSLLEHVRGRAFSQLAYLRYSAVGVTLLLFLFSIGIRNDHLVP
ncbi:MAG TPA: M50 family metallopeptidase [Gaiellaceae bacterium]|jgi:regulator of sigma E protease|nr:M50 family metallopeptidase [Gaiellaceae bacterium]